MSKFRYGGQAMVEGVMMKGKHYYAIAVRSSDGEISVRKERVESWFNRWPILRRPLLRGCAVLWEMLILGLRCLEYSVQQANSGAAEPVTAKDLPAALAKLLIVVGALFVVVPAIVVGLVQNSLSSNIGLNILEGTIRMLLLTGSVAVLGRLPHVRRMFQYHGAEHMAINCWEARRTLKLSHVRQFAPIQGRCGTNFWVLVILVSMVVFGMFGRPPLGLRILTHLALAPLVVGLAFEVIRLAGAEPQPLWVGILLKPGLLLQYLTTAHPDEQQLEVAVAALQAVIDADKQYQAERKVIPFPLPAS